MLCIPQELGQGGAGPGGDDIEGLEGHFFHALVFDCDWQTHPLGRSAQKSAFLGGGLEEGDRNPVPEQFGQNQPWKPCSRTQIHQSLGRDGNQGGQLGGIPEMAAPKIVQGPFGNQIVTAVPIPQQVRVIFQPFQCFT